MVWTEWRWGGGVGDAQGIDQQAVLAANFLQQQIEIAVARREYDHVRLRCELEHVQGDAHVPVSLGGPVAPLNVGLQFHFETYRSQDILKLLLLCVVPADGESDGFHDLSVAGDFGPEFVVIEVAREALPRRVIDDLHIDENGAGLHAMSQIGRTQL